VRILAVPGSLRAGSFNAALARAAVELAPAEVEIELYEGLGALPHYDADLDGEDVHPAVADLRERIAAADALLVVTPEYNGSIPGALKNAIDWASRPRENAPLAGKTVAIAGATTGNYGAIWAQQDLRKVLGIARARVTAGELPVARAQFAFDEELRLVDETVRERLEAHVLALAAEAAPDLIAA
jgi:chromate reductase, NAD(P)H dehydrogenase (quinone)